ncbi:alpha/beta-hydrolase [Lophiostoma macrostomum CBS 122681]|uniref:Carboxylic ester hydrolase n=1 Tax=Lophiostoma macrostomum CBS 122681 TaxID=1314788 RepID=A0A6A6SYY5_9PLEO|nr:alpha/beta-hydrolase [Lophiostoma macrostomum CBS 122681]
MAFSRLASVFLSLTLPTVLAIPSPAPTSRHEQTWGWSHNTTTPPTVTIKNGTLSGLHSTSYNQDFFLGIPFAQPPTGPLRFRVPQSINTSWTHPYSATQYSASCVGYGSDDWPYAALSEDCLYLNVVRPAGFSNASLPVAFWIHGGGLFEGSAVDERYNLSAVVARSVQEGHPVMAVSTNYRVSMWGFVTGEEVLRTGNANLGFRDQRLAMHWVRENIAAFGGDPSKVTIWGESAGALSVGMHLTAYGGRDDSLFRAAIMESGNPINYGSFNYSNSSFTTAAAALGCSNATSQLDCLRGIDFETLNAYINSSTTANNNTVWKPIIDHDFIQGPTSLQLAAGAFVHVPIIDGANSDEGTAFGIVPMDTRAQFNATLQTVDMPTKLTADQATQVLAAYPANITDGAVPTNLPASYVPGPEFGAASRSSDAYYGDVTMIAPRRATCQAWSAAGLAAYCYRFNTIPAGLPPTVGVTHFQEVAFVFDNTAGLGYSYVGVNPFEGMPQSYVELAHVMSGAWTRFVAEGTPGDWWPRYEVGAQNWVFDANVTGLGYAEDDTWRREGIELINSWAADVYGR